MTLPGQNAIRVMLVEDHHVVRAGIAAIIDRQSDMSVVSEAATGEQSVESFAKHRPDVTLMDLRLPGMGGIDAIRGIRKQFPEARIVVLTTYDGDEDIYRALEAGAWTYLIKDVFREELLETIRAVHRGERPLPSPVASRLAERLPRSGLSQRELEVLSLIVKGKSNKEIGESLFITEGTVKGHVNHLLNKLGVSDRTQAVTAALKRGIVHI